MPESTTSARTAREVAEAVARMVAGDGTIVFADLFADDGVLEYPYAPPGMPERLAGRAAIAEFHGRLSQFRSAIQQEGTSAEIYETSDPEVVIATYEHHGEVLTTGRPYRSVAVGIMRVRGGMLVSYTDYMNPLTIAQITGREADLAAALTGSAELGTAGLR